MRPFRFAPAFPRAPGFTAGDGLIVLGIATLLWAGVRLAVRAPIVVGGPSINLSYAALPWYALLSIGRMSAAYTLSLGVSLLYGRAAARGGLLGKILMPALDVLQSIPILSFLPVALLGLSAILPQRAAAEMAAIVLIFTSQVWNMTYSFYQSLTTIPRELSEAAAVFRFDPWLRWKTLEMPFAAQGLIWNSMMSWAGGWFFLMAAEIFTVGHRDFRLPGLGAYLQTAAAQGNLHAILAGTATLVLAIIALNEVIWRPVLVWADKFRVEMVAGSAPPGSWFHGLVSRSWLVRLARERVLAPLGEWLDAAFRARFAGRSPAPERASADAKPGPRAIVLLAVVGLALVYGGYRAALLLASLPREAWGGIGLGVLATFARVTVALAIALLWTIPAGVAIGSNRRLAAILQPVVQVVASIPATALFPVFVLALLRLPRGLDLAAVVLMLMGTQWYLLFNVIAGTSAIPQDLRDTTALLRLPRIDRWRTLILPALFPYIVTGAVTAAGGAWNASIVAEHVDFGGKTHATAGIGALIARATAASDYPLLLGGTLALVLTVVAINRIFWRWLYRVAEERYRME